MQVVENRAGAFSSRCLFRCAGVPVFAYLSSNFTNLFLPWLQLDKAQKALESPWLLGSTALPCSCECEHLCEHTGLPGTAGNSPFTNSEAARGCS